jgi:aminopeptidase N
MVLQLAQALQADWEWAWEAHQVAGPYVAAPEPAGRRALANLALAMLCLDATARGDVLWQGRAYQRFKDAANMTDREGALWALLASHSEMADLALPRFHDMFRGDALVLDKWFALQASAPERDGRVFARAKALLKHPDFTLHNPNRARSLVRSLCGDNPAAFHRADAAGYVFWSERVIELDAFNPQLAARIARVMDRWAQLAEPYRSAAREAIARVAARADLSNDVREVVTRALET